MPLLGRPTAESMTLSECQREAIESLRTHHVQAPELTASLLLGHVIGRTRAWLIAHSEDHIDEAARERFARLVEERCDGVPTQYLRGTQEFYQLEFRVTPDVLIPRPETEHLVEAALERVHRGHHVLDLGTGSGAVAVALALNSPEATVTATDLSFEALGIARENALRLGCEIQLCQGDVVSQFADATFDIVVSNPPYVPLRDACGLQRELRHEPSVALFGGEDGLEVTRRLVRDAPRVLRPGGWLLIEIGFGTRDAVDSLLRGAEWTPPEFLPDLAGIDRVAAVQSTSISRHR